MPDFLSGPVQGFQGLQGMTQQELLNLALQSLGQTLAGPTGAPTADARVHAIQLADRMRTLDPSWNADAFLGQYVQPGVQYGPEVARALQNYAYNEMAHRGVHPDVAKRYLPAGGSGNSAEAIMRDLDFATKWQAANAQVMDPRTGQFVMTDPTRQYMNLYGVDWMTLSGQGPGMFNQSAGGIDQDIANAGLDLLARASGVNTPRRISVADDLIQLFQREGFTRDMVQQAILQNVGRLTSDEINRIQRWLDQSDLPSRYQGDTNRASLALQEYFNQLDQAMRNTPGGIQFGSPVAQQFGLMYR